MSKKNKITLNLTDEDMEAFKEGMAADKQKDLAPWIVSAVLLYLRDRTDLEYCVDQTYGAVTRIEKKLDQLSEGRRASQDAN